MAKNSAGAPCGGTSVNQIKVCAGHPAAQLAGGANQGRLGTMSL